MYMPSTYFKILWPKNGLFSCMRYRSDEGKKQKEYKRKEYGFFYHDGPPRFRALISRFYWVYDVKASFKINPVRLLIYCGINLRMDDLKLFRNSDLIIYPIKSMKGIALDTRQHLQRHELGCWMFESIQQHLGSSGKCHSGSLVLRVET